MGNVRTRRDQHAFLDLQYTGFRSREISEFLDSPERRKRTEKFFKEIAAEKVRAEVRKNNRNSTPWYATFGRPLAGRGWRHG